MNFEKYAPILFDQRMQDAVEARKKTKNGRMGYGMINHAENMLRIVFDLAGRRARNYIIDQHNCQAAAQRRKLSYFTGKKPQEAEFNRFSAIFNVYNVV